jgi:putative transposase
MSRAISPGSGRPYGLARVCRTWRMARAKVYRQRIPLKAGPPRRPGPVGPMPDAALVAAIRAILAESPFHGEGHRKGLGPAAPGRHPYLAPARAAANA